MQKFIVDQTLCGCTIKEYFARQNYSTSQIKRYKYGGEIKVNGETVTVRYVLQTGDVVELSSNDRLVTPSFAPTGAKILYCDKYLYVAYKPYGIAVHPDRAHRNDTLGNMLATTFGEDFRLRIITRLDKTTSGLVLGAFDEITAEKLNKMLSEHEIEKVYVAEAEGRIEKDCGTINASLLRLDGENKTVADEKGKSAETVYEVMERRSNTTLVKLRPITGRTHQLRAHLASIGHPIVGDVLHGGRADKRIKLHCEKLEFTHPYDKKTVSVSYTGF